MRCAVDAQLAFQIVTTRVDQLVSDSSLAISDLADNDCVLFPASRVNDELAFKFSPHASWLEDSVRRVVGILIIIRVRQLLHAVEAPPVKISRLRNGQAVPIT